MSFVLPIQISRTVPVKIPYIPEDKTYLLKRQEELEKALAVALHQNDELLSELAHQLKNPLTSIILQTQMLKKIMEFGYDQENWDQMQKTVDKSLGQLSRLNKLIDTMLDS